MMYDPFERARRWDRLAEFTFVLLIVLLGWSLLRGCEKQPEIAVDKPSVEIRP